MRQPKFVLRDWVANLTIQMQGTLLTAVRGPDNVHKHDPSKKLVRVFRCVIMHNALPFGPKNSFAGDGSQLLDQPMIDEFFDSIDQYPHHWLMHFMHCAEIVGYTHPDVGVANSWRGFYLQLASDLHVTPETKDEMSKRLAGDGTF